MITAVFINLYAESATSIYQIPFFPAHKMHRDFFIRNFRKKMILILVIYWNKTGLLHTKINNHNIIHHRNPENRYHCH
jgi:hypothetical protein